MKNSNTVFAVIKSNTGNHSGFNVKWSLIDTCYSLNEAKKVLVNQSLNLNDNHIYRNGRAWCTETKEYIYTTKNEGFSYDGFRYKIITALDLEDYNGGSNGYLPNEILDVFN